MNENKSSENHCFSEQELMLLDRQINTNREIGKERFMMFPDELKLTKLYKLSDYLQEQTSAIAEKYGGREYAQAYADWCIR